MSPVAWNGCAQRVYQVDGIEKKMSNRSKKVALGAANNTLEVERDPRRLPKSVKINRISWISIGFC